MSSATTSVTWLVEDVVPIVARRDPTQASCPPARCPPRCSQARSFAPVYTLTRASREPDQHPLCHYDLRKYLTTSNCQSDEASNTYRKPPPIRKANKLPADTRRALFDHRYGRLSTLASRNYSYLSALSTQRCRSRPFVGLMMNDSTQVWVVIDSPLYCAYAFLQSGIYRVSLTIISDTSPEFP